MTEPPEQLEPVPHLREADPQLEPAAGPTELGHARLEPEPDAGDLWILLKVSGPIMVATISRAVMQFVDFVMVSQLDAATEAQAAVGASGVTLFILIGSVRGRDRRRGSVAGGPRGGG